MKTCKKCGCEIVLGVNGCTLMEECYKCHGGFPVYPVPIVKEYPDSMDYMEYWESKCLDNGDTSD